MTFLKFALASLSIALTLPNYALSQSLLPSTQLNIKGIAVHAEVAATEAARQKGLMFRQQLPENHGMLFVFEQSAIHCFWMKNTPLPLSIAFIDAKGIITHITDMKPHDETTHCPPANVLYALEMAQGWFQKYDIKEGANVGPLPKP